MGNNHVPTARRSVGWGKTRTQPRGELFLGVRVWEAVFLRGLITIFRTVFCGNVSGGGRSPLPGKEYGREVTQQPGTGEKLECPTGGLYTIINVLMKICINNSNVLLHVQY